MTETTICRLDDLVDGAGQRFDVEGHRLAVVRIGESVYVIGDRCTHAEASLAEGEVDPETCHIECWRHGSNFSLKTGEPDVLPATRPVPVYEAHVRDGEVVVVLADQDAEVDA
jgi:3-phenylpropionate/trans-cinnamate dioxygenase ferredoxin subunit